MHNAEDRSRLGLMPVKRAKEETDEPGSIVFSTRLTFSAVGNVAEPGNAIESLPIWQVPILWKLSAGSALLLYTTITKA